jgi:hypothetical protein
MESNKIREKREEKGKESKNMDEMYFKIRHLRWLDACSPQPIILFVQQIFVIVHVVEGKEKASFHNDSTCDMISRALNKGEQKLSSLLAGRY